MSCKEPAPDGKLREPEVGKKSLAVLYVQNDISKAVIDSRWGLMGMMEAGVKNVKTWLVANIPHDPDLFDGLVDTFGSVHPRSSHRSVV